MQTPAVSLDIFLARAHALAIPYLMGPSTTFLVYVSPLAYYTLLQASSAQSASSNPSKKAPDSYSKLDIPLSILKNHFANRQLRASGLSFATLSLISSSTLPASPQTQLDLPSYLGRPFFRLPGTSVLAGLDHTFIRPPDPSTLDDQTRDAWVLDFTDGGRLPGILMTSSRMCEIRQVLEPISAIGGNIGLSMHMAPLSGSWLNSLVNFYAFTFKLLFTFYVGQSSSSSIRTVWCELCACLEASHLPISYNRSQVSPGNKHPLLRLRLTAPNEAGFLLEKVPVNSLKEVYGVLEVSLKTVCVKALAYQLHYAGCQGTVLVERDDQNPRLGCRGSFT